MDLFFMFFPVAALPAWLMSLLPGLAGGFINAFLQQQQINKQNAYNDPRAVMQRMMNAGLPSAAFGAVGASAQSQIPDTSGIGNAVTGVFQSQQQKTQGELALELLRGARADTDVKVEEAKGALSPFVDSDDYSTSGKSFAEVGKAQAFYIQNNLMKLQAQEGRIKEVELQFQKALKEGGKDSVSYKQAKAALDNLLLDLDFKGFHFGNEKLRAEAMNTILRKVQENGTNLFEAILMTLIGSLSGGLKSKFGSIGF